MADNIKERSPAIDGDGDGEVESMLSWLLSMESDEEEGAMELSKFLEASAEKTHPVKVRIIDDPYWHPLVFQTAASYITINGNEEVCGSSFSDSDTSYMVGIGMGSGAVVGDGGAWDGGGDEARGWMEMEVDWGFLVNGESGDGCCDDDMLAVFLGEDVGQAR